MKLSVFSLILTVFLLWFTIQIESSYEVYLAYLFVLTIGIVHGANDISLINHLTTGASKSKYKYLGLYVGLIATMSIGFFQFPFFALLIFIVFSCYHFGEQHFYNQLNNQNTYSTALYLAYGVLIFGLLFYLNANETALIIMELTGVMLNETIFLYFLILGFVATALFVYLSFKNFETGVDYFQEFFLILLFAILFKMASLLWAFAIYFIIWHSIPSLKDQTFKLYGRIDKASFIKYFKASFLNWIISLVGLVIVYYASTLLNIRFITLFFAFLAAITIPHVIVMYYLNKK